MKRLWLCYLLCIGITLMKPMAIFAEPISGNPKGLKMTKSNTAAQFIAQELAKGKKTNRLINEKSPYLLQHAFNPVDWHPWGEEAFRLALEQNKPIFLSIGYSTCHWCHVMAHESFEDPAVAAIMNEYFICIKVDREERPDVDQLYMAATQALTGGGGWPMSVFLTPDLKPFYAGTYFPPENKHGLPSFTNLLEAIHNAWLNDQQKITQSAEKITAYLQQGNDIGNETSLNDKILDKAFRQIAANYDAVHGGFGKAPKFPRPMVFTYLLRYYHRTGEKQALEMVLVTLRKMAAGGMYDHIGGGFHRYSVDSQWRVPHFEKMLYDQGLLVPAYLEAYQITHDPFYANVARDILDYVLRDMTGPEGAFYSAEDADSADPENPDTHGEGLFYLWRQHEITKILGEEGAAVFNYHYGIEPNGNALDDPHGEFSGRNILYVSRTLEDTAAKFNKSVDKIATLLVEARQKLFEVRRQRPRPHLDDKVITSWNGHMISALARGYQVLREPRHLEAAEKAAQFIMSALYDPETRQLKRRYRDGTAGLDAHLDDYAFMVSGLLDLYESSFQAQWLQYAITLTGTQIELFEDSRAGGFFDVSGRDASILMRMKSDYDGAEPTGNSVAALNLLRLAQMTDNQSWSEKATSTIAAFADRLAEYPPIMPQMLIAYDFQLDKPKRVVVAGKPGAADTEKMLDAIHSRFLPNKIILLADGGEGQALLSQHLQFLADIAMQENKATAYLCQNYTCKLPTTDVNELVRLLEK